MRSALESTLMRRLILTFVAVAVLTAFGVHAYKQWRVNQTEAKKEQEVAASRASLIAALKDPQSVQFRSDRLSRVRGTVCGEMNAKNSMGGYVGFKRYIAKRGQFVIDGGAFSNWSLTENPEPAPEYYVDALQLVERGRSPSATALQSAEANAIAEEVFAWLWQTNCQ